MDIRRLFLAAWVFTPYYAVKVPDRWKVLSQSDLPGVGHELIVGLSAEHSLRVFRSGDKLTVPEFRKRMQEVVASASVEKKGSLLETPQVLNFGKGGARLRLVFKSRLRQRDLFEAHLPMAIGGQGLDLSFLAPLASYPGSLKEAEGVFQDFRPYWTGEKFDHPKPSAKP